MISTEARKFILKLILLFAYSYRANGCDSNRQLYTEIGCKPIYNNDSNSCPVAYNCEDVFTRPSDKCYLNGNVYEPRAHISETDSALAPCLAACFCDQHDFNNKTVTKFTCAHVECPSYFTRIAEPCYFQYSKDKCCEIRTYCPEAKTVVHECVYENNTYKDGQRFYVDDYFQCVCSPDFNGTVSDRVCKKVGCNYETLYIENILKRSAPVYFEKADGCPIEWYHYEYDVATAVGTSSASKSGGNHECKYGDVSFPIGQQLTIGRQSDSDLYTTTCSCNTPPLFTCIRTRKQNVEKK